MTDFIIRKFIKDYQNVDHPGVRTTYGNTASVVGIICNVLLFAGKLLVGLLTQSVSITADAVNNLSDSSSSIVSFFGFKLASRPADKDHPYGHGRYEYLAGLFVAVLIMVIGVEIFKSSLGRILHPVEVDYSLVSVIVLLASIGLKFWMMFFYLRIGKTINSQTLLATAADSRNDVIATGAVLLAALITKFTSVNLDGWMGLVVAVFIVINGFGIVRTTIDPLLGKAPDTEYITRIRDKVLSYPGVLGTHDLMVHDYGPARKFASVHVEMDADTDGLLAHELIDRIEQDFREDEGLQLTVHYDPIPFHSDTDVQIRQWLTAEVQLIDPELSIHDLKIFREAGQTRLVFDCVKPENLAMSSMEIKKRINERVKLTHPRCQCLIQVESYAPTQRLDIDLNDFREDED